MRYRLYFICLFLLLALAASLIFGITLGSAKLSLEQIIFALEEELLYDNAHITTDNLAIHDIIWLLRLPRIILAGTIGAGLATCGVIMQAIVKNPLADPYILGVSSGASLGATMAIMLGIGVAWGENFIGLAAFIGAFAISLAVVFIANIGGRANSIKLLLAGMALSSLCGAISSFIIYYANNAEGMQTITYWMMGSMAGAHWSLLRVLLPLFLAAIVFFITQSRILNLMLLGDEVAITLGRDLHLYRQVYLLVSSLIVGFAVYSAGMIGFVGLIIPHAVRCLVGQDHKQVLPISALLGATFLIWADILCRIILPRTELPIGILISLIGAPCFVYLLVKRSYGFGGQ